MKVESKPALEPSAMDQELELALEQAPELEQALPEEAPRLLLLPSGSRHPALREPS